jgi:hypothetical protein
MPANLTATAVSSSQINLSWNASTDNVGVSGYKIYRNGTQLATVTAGTSYQNTGLSPSTSYSYTVAAYDALGNTSAQSAVATATTQAAPPTADKFIIGDRVHTTSKLKVRSTPTMTGRALCTQNKNVYGTVIAGPKVAAGYTWWQVNYDSSCDGWSVQDWLSK